MDKCHMTTDNLDVSAELLSLAQELVRIRSFSGQEGEIAKFIAAKMEALGYDEVKIDRYGNVLGRVGQGERTMLFNSHSDTVKVTDEALWQVAPFSGEIVDGWLSGRGRGGHESRAGGLDLRGGAGETAGSAGGQAGLRLGTVDEEYCDGVGLGLLLAESRIRPDYAVICEPSGNLIATGHKGKAQVIIRTRGVSAHGSAPEKGANAIYEMAEIIQRVEQRTAS